MSFEKFNSMIATRPGSPRAIYLTRGRRIASGFTLIELLIVIAILALLSAIVFPVFGRARDSSRRTVCISNVKQIALAFQLYAQDHDERLPVDRTSTYVDANGNAFTAAGAASLMRQRQFWYDLIEPYAKSNQVFNDPNPDNKYFDGCRYFNDVPPPVGYIPCTTPANSWTTRYLYRGRLLPVISPDGTATRNDRDRLSYGYAAMIGEPASITLNYNHLASIKNASEKLLFAEATRYNVKTPDLSKCGDVVPRHFKGVVVGFADGHAKWLNWDFVCANPYDAAATQDSKKLWITNYVAP